MKRAWLFGLVALLIAAAAFVWLDRQDPNRKPLVTMLVNGRADGRMVAGQPGELSFQFAWKGTEPVTRFDVEHDKLMHLVIVRQDLASYAHVHPLLDPATGWFRLPVNQPVTDPDNRDAPRAFVEPGRYLMFAEVKPHGHPFIVMYTFELEATGARAAVTVPLAPDPMEAGEIHKYFGADGRARGVGELYHVTLRVTRGGKDEHRFVTLAFHIEYGPPLPPGRQGRVEYAKAKDLETWLSMPGHAILLSESGAGPRDKQFRHIHAAMGDAGSGAGSAGGAQAGSGAAATDGARRAERYGPDLEFYLRAAEIPLPGVYKLWGQFKHRGHVLTFPFVIRL